MASFQYRKGSTILGLAALVAALSSTRLSAVEEVRASHILLRSKEESDSVRAEIVANGGTPKAFSAACRVHSLDVYTKRQAGDLGWFPRVGKMDAVFSEATFALSAGEISQPVQTPHGWHLILLKDRRDRTKEGTTPIASTPKPPLEGSDPAGGDPDSLIPEGDDPHAGHDHGPGEHGDTANTTAVEPVVATPAEKASGTRRALADRRLHLLIESARGADLGANPNQFEPTRAVELNLVLKNSGANARQVPALSLLPLGFQLAQTHDGKKIAGDFSSLTAPASFFSELATYEMRGLEINLNDYFPELYAVGRFDLAWDAPEFFTNLETRFPEVKELPGYADVKADLNSSLALTVDKVRRDVALNWRRNRSMPFSFSIVPRFAPKDRVFARIDVRGEAQPIVIELDMDKQFAAARHFARLALEGFYDRLSFYDVQPDNFVLIGCPSNTGTGAPSMMLPRISNLSKTPHVEGTVSFVSRNSRAEGPVRGGEVGSIFFVSLTEHPEWNDVHVPFGRVIEGLDVAKRLQANATVEQILILPASEYAASGTTLASAGGTSSSSVTSAGGVVEALIKTAKGDIKLALNDAQAPNSVANFVTLAEKSFYDKAEGGGKQTFFNVMRDATGGGILIQGGSPTNGPIGGETYRLVDEVNELKCTRGAIAMTKLWDPETSSYVQDSASSQFFICLRDIPAYDYEKAFAVFGYVAAESLSVLDQIAAGDEISAVQVTKKGARDYSQFRKAE